MSSKELKYHANPICYFIIHGIKKNGVLKIPCGDQINFLKEFVKDPQLATSLNLDFNKEEDDF